jgi:probable F420-dependent oxidoreductase
MPTQTGLGLGLGLPQAFLDGSIDLDVIGRFARRAEAAGFDDLWAIEQTLGRIAVLEPLTLLSYVAAITDRIRLGTSVMVLNHRNAVHLAKELSSLDQLSRGRLTAGIGLGGGTSDYRTFGISPERHVTRFVEGVRTMRALWTDGKAVRDSKFWPLDGVSMEPKPVQQPSIPLWFGARAPEALRRAVDLGDGWMGAGSSTIADYLQQIATIRAILGERGRADFPLSKRLYMAVDTDAERARSRMREWVGSFYGDPAAADRWAIAGSAGDIIATIQQLREAGATHLLLHPVFDYEEQLEIIAGEIVPRL